MKVYSIANRWAKILELKSIRITNIPEYWTYNPPFFCFKKMKDLAPTPNSCTLRVFQTCSKSYWKVVGLPKWMWFASSVRARRRKFLWRLRCLRMSAQVWGKRRGFWPNTWAIEPQDWEKRKHGKAFKSAKSAKSAKRFSPKSAKSNKRNLKQPSKSPKPSPWERPVAGSDAAGRPLPEFPGAEGRLTPRGARAIFRVWSDSWVARP